MAENDRVLMKAKSTFNNQLITVKQKTPKDGETVVRRMDEHTVDTGDEFSTHEDHAKQLEQSGLAERIDGDAEPASERALALRGAQTATPSAITGARPTIETTAAVGSAATKKA